MRKQLELDPIPSRFRFPQTIDRQISWIDWMKQKVVVKFLLLLHQNRRGSILVALISWVQRSVREQLWLVVVAAVTAQQVWSQVHRHHQIEIAFSVALAVVVAVG